MSEKLKPCPFCGGIAELKHYIIKGYEPDRMYYVECSKCGQTVVKGEFDTTYHSDKWAINKAIKAWNNRTSPWHTGTPTEEGWYLVAYQHKDKMTYRAVRFFLEEGLDMEFLESEGGIYYPDIWKAVAWQKIEPYKEKEDGNTD